MKAARLALGTVGAAGAAYGLGLLIGLGPDQLLSVLVWVVGAVVVHDGVFAPLVVVLGVAVHAPVWLRPPLLWVLVVLGPLTLVAVPVLGRFGAKADNPTLLDRPYWLGYVVVVALVLAFTALGTAVRRPRPVPGAGDTGGHAASS